MLLWLVNLLSGLVPQTRMFALRRVAYRAAGVGVSDGVRISGGTRVHFPNSRIGAGTWLGAGCQLISTADAMVDIGSNCDVGPEVMFVVGTHEIGSTTRRAGAGMSRGISVGSGTWVGARATFTAGAAVGRGCVVAAGSLVRDEFPDDVMLAGVPARVVRHLSR